MLAQAFVAEASPVLGSVWVYLLLDGVLSRRLSLLCWALCGGGRMHPRAQGIIIIRITHSLEAWGSNKRLPRQNTDTCCGSPGNTATERPALIPLPHTNWEACYWSAAPGNGGSFFLLALQPQREPRVKVSPWLSGSF